MMRSRSLRVSQRIRTASNNLSQCPQHRRRALLEPPPSPAHPIRRVRARTTEVVASKVSPTGSKTATSAASRQPPPPKNKDQQATGSTFRYRPGSRFRRRRHDPAASRIQVVLAPQHVLVPNNIECHDIMISTASERSWRRFPCLS
jgi:hypothetical protein